MARPKFIVLGFPEQGFVLSLGFTAFATNECPFYDYNTPRLCPHSHMSFRRAVASPTSHRERKVGTSLFSSFVWLCTNDVEGKHCAQKEKKDRERTKKRGENKGGGKRRRKQGKKLEVRAPAVLVFFIYFAFDYATSRILFLSPFLMLLVQIFMRD